MWNMYCRLKNIDPLDFLILLMVQQQPYWKIVRIINHPPLITGNLDELTRLVWWSFLPPVNFLNIGQEGKDEGGVGRGDTFSI